MYKHQILIELELKSLKGTGLKKYITADIESKVIINNTAELLEASEHVIKQCIKRKEVDKADILDYSAVVFGGEGLEINR